MDTAKRSWSFDWVGPRFEAGRSIGETCIDASRIPDISSMLSRSTIMTEVARIVSGQGQSLSSLQMFIYVTKVTSGVSL